MTTRQLDAIDTREHVYVNGRGQLEYQSVREKRAAALGMTNGSPEWCRFFSLVEDYIVDDEAIDWQGVYRELEEAM